MEFKATFGQKTGFGEVMKSVTYMGKTYHYADKVMVVDENGVHSFIEKNQMPTFPDIPNASANNLHLTNEEWENNIVTPEWISKKNIALKDELLGRGFACFEIGHLQHGEIQWLVVSSMPPKIQYPLPGIVNNLKQ